MKTLTITFGPGQVQVDNKIQTLLDGSNFRLLWDPANLPSESQFELAGRELLAVAAIFRHARVSVQVPVRVEPVPQPAVVAAVSQDQKAPNLAGVGPGA